MKLESIARIAHEANRALQAEQQSEGIPVAPPWDKFPDDQKAGVVDGVRKAIDGATPEQLHKSWCEFKRADGWRYGPVKDAEAKTHPCLVDYAILPADQKLKDDVFSAVVTALTKEQ